MMQRFTHPILLFAGLALAPAPVRAQQAPGSFTVEQVKSYPFPAELTASGTGSRIAWTFNERGQRNIWVAEGPAFTPRRLTGYSEDDGQELTSVSLSADGKWVVRATFPEPGTYVLRCQAHDGGLATTSDVTFVVSG